MVIPLDPGPTPEHGPASAAAQQIGFVPRPRIRWFAPGVLVRTGVQVAVSAKFAEFIDQREAQAVRPVTTTDLSGADELWVDYVSDCGDGFDSAATVASVIARDGLELDGTATRAGSVLVMGGDQAYPYATIREYRDRLVGPYRSMLPWTSQPRRLFAIPGNHDWYDGLSSFLKLFCQGRWIGGRKTEQTRSYFALDLPGPWRMWAIDIALGTDIDGEQLDYFRARAAELDDGAAIILCSAKPSWTDAGPGNTEAYATLDFFERSVIGDRARLRVSLTGDSHHYARYQGPDGQQKITAGGGGAYLSPTHHLRPALELPPPESVDPGKSSPTRHTLATTYPSADESRSLRSGVFGRIHRNGNLWLLVGALYLLLALPGVPAVLALQRGEVAVLPTVLTAVLVAGLLAALVQFARIKPVDPRRSALLANGHGAAHLIVLFTAIALTSGQEILALGAAAAMGALLGPLVVAAYLRVADAAGLHGNELFSAMGLESHRSFLRLHIDAEQRLTIYPIGMRRTARWTFGPGTTRWSIPERWFTPDREPEPHLIEDPVVVLP